MPDEISSAGAEDMLRSYLAQRSEPCPSCEYDLRGLTGATCPECGQALRLRVGLVHPNLAAFITGLVALAGAAGFGGLMLIFFLFLVLIKGGGGGREILAYLTVTTLVLVVSAVLLWSWIRSRGWLGRQSAGKRWTLAMLCFILPLIGLLGFISVPF